MVSVLSLVNFFNAIEKDARISTTHIGIYAALIRHCQKNDGQNPFSAYSHEIMKIAKISASSTYHKTVRDLNAFGYIKYEPSFKRNCPSKLHLIEL